MVDRLPPDLIDHLARQVPGHSSVLPAANLGDDADTTAAICGQIAGAHYGVESIPPHWLHRLHMREFITELADRLHATAPS